MTRFDETKIVFQNPLDQLEKGLEFCRKGDWKTGLELLDGVAQQQKEPGKLPSRYYSFLGYALAHQQRKIDAGIKLCRFAIKQEFFQPDNYLNLARTYLLAQRRDAAYRAIEKGLKVDANHPELLSLQRTMGKRKAPVLTFLSRSNPLNRLLGSLRHAMRRSKEARAPAAKSAKSPASVKR